MFNLSDKELDRLSRDAADNYEVKNNTSSWEALEQRLNKELAPASQPQVPSPKGLTLPFVYTAVIIAIIGASILIVKSKQKSNLQNKPLSSVSTQRQNENQNLSEEKSSASKIEDKKNSTVENDKAGNSTTNEEISKVRLSEKKQESNIVSSLLKSENKNFKKETNKNINSDNQSSIAKNNTDEIGKNKTGINKNTFTNSSSVSSVGNKLNSKTIKDRRKHQNPNLQNANNPGSNENNTINSSSANFTSTEKYHDRNLFTSQQKEQLNYAPKATLSKIANNTSVIISDAELRASASNAKDITHLGKKNKSLYTNRSLQIGLQLAPDFSKVKYDYYNNRIGNSIGITIGYQVFKHISVNSGFLYDHKYYQMDGDDFHPKPNSIPQNIFDIDFVNGSNKIFEIPLNLRYDFSFEDNTIFFVSSGLSSYLMKGQNYLYYCRTGSLGFREWKPQSYNLMQDFWFSILNISAGFETSISNSFSFQIDPYVKVPLRGVGFGNAQLSSYGINVSLKYAPVLKRSRN